jgi:hypothetical protein
MDASKKRMFHYHADASPLGGHITHPFEKIVHTQASTSLAQAGGHAESRIESYQLDNAVTVSSGPAYSHATGVVNKTTGAWTTLVTSVVENLNVLEVVTADRIVSKLHVEYPLKGDHPRISIIGSKFVNLQVNGEVIKPILDIDLLKSESKGEFPDKHLTEEKVFNSKVSSQYKKIAETKGTPEWLEGRHASMKSPEGRKKKGYVLCSLVEELQGAKSGTSFGHVLHVPGFGNIFFAELVIAPSSYRLTMMRIEMGCLAEGNISAGSVFTNGATFP